MNISKEVKVGLVTIFAIAMFVWGFNYLKGTNLFVNNTTVYAIYPKVPGLAVSSPIIINGVQSGVVDAIYFHPDKSSRVIVKMNIAETGLMIPKNSVANLISLDLLSSKAIGLSLGDSPIGVKNGDTLLSHFEKSMIAGVTEQMLPIKERAENLLSTMDSAILEFKTVMINLNEVFDDQNKKNLSLALANLNTTMYSFNLLAKNFSTAIDTSIKPTMQSYKSLADSLAALDINATLVKAQETLDGMSTIMEKINNGEGTMGQLINNDTLYHNLKAVSKDMDLLLIEVKEHPKRFVHFSLFGKKDKSEKNK